MTVVAIIGFCVVLLVLAFLAPRLSRHFQRAGDRPLGAAGTVADSAPGKLGTWLRKPFDKSRRAVGKSGSAGRRGRAKAPF
jgi:hypothetical protein